MRVLIVIDTLDASGGAERSLAAMAPHLMAAGIDVHVAYFHDRARSLATQLRREGATVHSLTGGRGRIGAATRAAGLVRLVQPNLVHTTLFEADIAGRVGARVASRPVVSSLVNVPYGAAHAMTPGMAAWKLKGAHVADVLTAHLAVRFHAITTHVADVMAARLRISRDRIDVVPRGRDPVRLGRRTAERRARIRHALGLRDGQPVVLAVGRQEWQKGHDTLIDATTDMVRRRPDITVLVAGRTGAQTDPLLHAACVRGLTNRVRILGFRDDVADLLCAADVFAFPSRWEGLGSALLEAMALEIPIVASDLPAVREVLTAREALLVPASEPRALAAAIDDCLARPAEASQRVESARRRFLDRFTAQAAAEGMVTFYERALALPRLR